MKSVQRRNLTDLHLCLQCRLYLEALVHSKHLKQFRKSLDKVLKGIYTDTFAKHLQQLINKKELKNAEVYAAANISKQYFSKLLKGQVKPSKEKVLALAVGL